MKKYKIIVKSDRRGIYDYPVGMCIATNNRRFRITRWGFRWEGNSGGGYTEQTYMDRERGRNLLKAYRKAVIAKMTENWPEYDHLCDILECRI